MWTKVSWLLKLMDHPLLENPNAKRRSGGCRFLEFPPLGLVKIQESSYSTNVYIFGACYGVLRFIVESGAKGCEVIIRGKLRAQRAKSMEFKDGYMISSGQPMKEYIDSAVGTKFLHIYGHQMIIDDSSGCEHDPIAAIVLPSLAIRDSSCN